MASLGAVWRLRTPTDYAILAPPGRPLSSHPYCEGRTLNRFSRTVVQKDRVGLLLVCTL